MALDTTVGGASSDSYGTLIEAASYHTSMGHPAWAAATDVDRESALRRAAMWLDGAYRLRLPGVRAAGRLQALEWPRSGAVDRSGLSLDGIIPVEVKFAQFEAALSELSAPGSLSPQSSSAQVVKSEKVGPVSVEYAVSSGDVSSTYPTLSSVEFLLSGILTSYGTDGGYPAFTAVRYGQV